MRLLLIEDSRHLVATMRRGLVRAGFDVDSATDGETGLRMARSRAYDVVVLDLMLPELPGLEVLRRLREGEHSVHVLVLTALDTVEQRVRGLQCGADDYLVKPFDFDELVARIQALTRRKYGKKATRIVVGPLEVDTTSRSARCGDAPISLTNREYRLLEYLAFRSGELVTRVEIQEHLYGSGTAPLSNVVDSAICALRAKLRKSCSAPLIRTRPRQGYVLTSELP